MLQALFQTPSASPNNLCPRWVRAALVARYASRPEAGEERSDRRRGRRLEERREEAERPEPPPAIMSEQHHAELAGALEAMGCPSEELTSPLSWEAVSRLLAAVAEFDEGALAEAKRRFFDFMSQPLRRRQKMALQHLLELLREMGEARAAAHEASHTIP